MSWNVVWISSWIKRLSFNVGLQAATSVCATQTSEGLLTFIGWKKNHDKWITGGWDGNMSCLACNLGLDRKKN